MSEKLALATTVALLAMTQAAAKAGPPMAKPAAFAMCAACHATAPGQPSTAGPNLFGVLQRKSGALPGFSYSPSLQKAAISWSPSTLGAFITAPQAAVPGTRMTYGERDPAKTKAIVDYLMSLK